ncbi:VOC family protein [Agromyces sp. LHK192]|uniref:VOC family protein n=1 Tax=Agromyces sp. LHK192 TaxID=2498704 RepID=UPI00196AED3D|nr:VOC family protein [Agromyces sp. LHK192]
MPRFTTAVGSMSVDDLTTARAFYAWVLGADVRAFEAGGLLVAFPDGHRIHVYDKGALHEPAPYTALNFVVDDIGRAVDDLIAAGVDTKPYDDGTLPTDDRGIGRSGAMARAWFRDPARNLLSVVQLPQHVATDPALDDRRRVDHP